MSFPAVKHDRRGGEASAFSLSLSLFFFFFFSKPQFVASTVQPPSKATAPFLFPPPNHPERPAVMRATPRIRDYIAAAQ